MQPASVTATEVTAEKQRPAHLFKPGQSGNPRGRPKGARSKLGEAFIAALQEDFDEHGPDVIRKVREEKPDAYLKVIASTLPKDLNVNVNAMSEMSDDELASVLAAVRALAASFDLAVAGAGEGAQGSAQPAQLVSPVQ